MSFQVIIEECGADGKPLNPAAGIDFPHPRPLAFWRAMLEKSAGVLPLPHGGTTLVSLDRWKGRDPNTTMIHIAIMGVDPAKVGTVDPNFKPPRA